VASPHIPPVLVRVEVDDVVEVVRRNVAVAEQRGGLGSGPVSNDAVAGCPEPINRSPQVAPDPGDAVAERPVKLDLIHAAPPLHPQEGAHRGLDVLSGLDVQAKRSPVDGGPFHVVEVEVVAPKQPVQRRDGEVAQMLMVDGVERAVVDEIDDVGHLDDGHPVRL